MTQYNELAYRPDPTTGQGQQVYNPTTGKAYGSPEQLAGDLGIQSTAIDWSKISNMNAGDMGGTAVSVPNNQQPPANISDITSQYDTLAQTIQDQIGQMDNQPSMTDTLTSQYNEWGIDPKEMLTQVKSLTDEANGYRKQIATLEDQKNQELLGIEERGGISVDLMTRRQKIVENQWNSRINKVSQQLSASALQIEAMQGNINLAKGFAEDYVNAATYDAQIKRDQINAFVNLNSSLLNDIKSDERLAIQNWQAQVNRDYDNARADKEAIAQLALTYPTVAKNILAAKTYDDAVRAAQPAVIQAQVKATTSTGNSNNTVFSTPEGNQVDIGTTEGIKSLLKQNPNWTYADMYSFMEKNTKLSNTAIGNLLSSAGLTNTPATKLTRSTISKLYSMPDDNEKSSWLANIFGGGKTNAEKLDEVMKSIEAYQDAGYTDDEILKLVKQ